MWQVGFITRAVRLQNVYLYSSIVRATFVAVIIELSCQTIASCRFILIDSLILLAYLPYGNLLHYSVWVFQCQ